MKGDEIQELTLVLYPIEDFGVDWEHVPYIRRCIWSPQRSQYKWIPRMIKFSRQTELSHMPKFASYTWSLSFSNLHSRNTHLRTHNDDFNHAEPRFSPRSPQKGQYRDPA